MTTVPAATRLVEQARYLRGLLGGRGPLAGASVGTVPILWNNVDLADLRDGTDAEAILDDIARTGYDGCQLGLGFPEGAELRATLAARDLRLAEVYASIRATVDGPTPEALAEVRERLRLLGAGGGEVFCIALDGSADRNEAAGHAGDADTPRLTDASSMESRMLSVPVSTKIAMIPRANPTSPTRFVMNAFLLASAAVRLRYQNPISR